MFQLLLLLPLFLLSSTVVASNQLRVFHRVFHPLEEVVRFSDLGSLVIGPEPSFAPISDAFEILFGSLKSLDEWTLYQVALEREGDQGQDHWDVTSIRACHLATSESATLRLHLTAAGKPYALDYFVSPVPYDGSCSKSSTQTLLPPSNTSLVIEYPTKPPQPKLKTPPPLTPEGAPVVPVPEKSFVQKYWIYILGFFIVMIATAGAEDPDQGRGGGGQK